ncbi:hypothetical protein [Clostridium sp. FP1]|uniref:hypothetical protein n=1 Tax=Clostridium sp. FP1 TaxID=2724076 RepID=UPI0013E91668|nr:hypothetical protein [Clostridium sp. FP1]MBZ9633033.1 hypothetical protein [Clostridium sp. FP1]
MQYNIENQDIENPDNPNLFEKLTENEKSELLNWIDDNFKPIESFTCNATSYGLKQKFSRTNFYLYNGAFKGAMLKAGFKVKNTSHKNWVFNISKRSNYFTLK